MGFILIFSCMMVSILYLSGCTMLDTAGSQAFSWKVKIQSNKDGDCSAEVLADRRDDVSDDSITIQGKGT
jgi:hypothetical protein